MEIIESELKGLFVIKPKVFEDARGYFFESYNKEIFEKKGLILDFVQDNQSLSQKGVLRGLHFQNPPFAQGKLVRVITGAVFDVAVDIRKHSATYGKWFGLELSEENKWQMYIPEGFAHGFLTLRNNTVFSYKCTGFYKKEAEDCLLWNDPDIGIQWNTHEVVLSDKDKTGKLFSSFDSLFT
ncbi:MAG: dTDP-4-dehydrorhamnose 3,5-epimerase [Bacteroidia bacterium]|jgi:dTDP-4-dehydrorhamnose 3,5-epimerase|nr:dTDP-4-dehydrorhamnose 3,5-epimerase [Bacteroidia bacterium]